MGARDLPNIVNVPIVHMQQRGKKAVRMLGTVDKRSCHTRNYSNNKKMGREGNAESSFNVRLASD